MVFVEGFGETFAASVCLGVGFGTGFGVAFGFGVEVAVAFGPRVAVAVGFGVGDGNSISLLAVVSGGFSSSASSFSRGFASTGGGTWFGAGDASSSDLPAATPSALPNQTIVSGFDGTLAATLQRISPDERSVRESNEHNVSPKTSACRALVLRRRVFRHLFWFSFCGDAELGDPRLLQSVH